MKPIPRKFLVIETDPPDKRFQIMCEMRDHTYTAEVPLAVGEVFLEKVFALYMELIRTGVAKPKVVRRR